MITSTLKRAFSSLPLEQRRSAVTTMAVGLVAAIFDVVGVASVMPFLAVAASPDSIRTSPTLNRVYETAGFSSTESFLIFLGFTAFALLVFGAAMRTLSVYISNRFIHSCRSALSSQLFETYLRQSYAFFLNRNSGGLAKEMYNEVEILVAQVIAPGIHIFIFGVTVVLMTTFLLFVDPIVTVLTVFVLALSYLAVYRSLRQRSAVIGKARSEASRLRFETSDAALGGAKTVKIMGIERQFLSRYRLAAQEEARYLAQNATISQVPRNAIEALALGGIILIVLTMLIRDSGTGSARLAAVLPQVGLFALAGYRMLPGLQAIYQAFTAIRFASNGLDGFFADFALVGVAQALPQTGRERLRLTQSLELRSMSFRYSAKMAMGIDQVSLTLERGQRIGIVGATGAGKTTLIDVMLGLLIPQQGEMAVDGVVLTDANRAAWQASIGYVPQDIYLLDGTVAENVAIGAGQDPIDRDRVRECLDLACVLDFVETDLPDGLDTGIGQRGVRLSGGQRQRIGIARALYRSPEFIVFDEATSALDTETEHQVMDAIRRLEGGKTIVMIAHRLTTIRDCDLIVVMDGGRVRAKGTYDELAASGLVHGGP